MMADSINVSSRMNVYIRRVVMEDLTPIPPQHSPHAAGPKQQHRSSIQHISLRLLRQTQTRSREL